MALFKNAEDGNWGMFERSETGRNIMQNTLYDLAAVSTTDTWGNKVNMNKLFYICTGYYRAKGPLG